MRCTHFEAREEDVKTSDNETKSDKGRGVMHGQAHPQQASSISQELRSKSNKQYCMSQGTRDSLKHECDYCRETVCRGGQSVPAITNCRNEDCLDKMVYDSILHQDNKNEIHGKVFWHLKDVLMGAVPMWYDTD